MSEILESRTVHSMVEGVTWTPGVHYRWSDEGFGKLEIIKFPPGVKTRRDRKWNLVHVNPLTIRYGAATAQPAPMMMGAR